MANANKNIKGIAAVEFLACKGIIGTSRSAACVYSCLSKLKPLKFAKDTHSSGNHDDLGKRAKIVGQI